MFVQPRRRIVTALHVWLVSVAQVSLLLSSSSFNEQHHCFFFVEGTLGGEKATIRTKPFTQGVTHRQNFCDRYLRVAESNGSVALKDALNGIQLRPVLQYGLGFPYFNYSESGGIDPDDPGLVANILDYIGAPERANFTWRDSFGVYTPEDKGPDKTWTEMLQWATDTYDLSIDKWAQKTERLDLGIAFCEPWFDASFIMVDKLVIPEDKNINYGNWLKPFDNTVWLVTIATILVSCFVYQFLEFMAGQREDRSFRKWFMDNFYMSAITFTQNYNYEPVSLSAKLFGISFAFWSMLIGATYTANLASLLVEKQGPPREISNIHEAIQSQMSMCTYAKSADDLFIKANYPEANRVPRPSIESAYEGVNNGECDLLIGTKQAWESFKSVEEYNPTCELKWVGRAISQVNAAFTTKVDPGYRCTGLVNEVFNYWLSEMKDKGVLDQEWEKFNEKMATPNFNCNANSEAERRQRQRRLQSDYALTETTSKKPTSTITASSIITATEDDDSLSLRNLKGVGSRGGAAGAAAEVSSEGSSDGEESLSIEQMAGVFLLHLVGSAVAIIVSFFSRVESKVNTKRRSDERTGTSVTMTTDEQSVQAQLETMQTSQRELSIQMEMIMSKLNTMHKELPSSSGDGDDDDDNSFHSANNDSEKPKSIFARVLGA